MAGAAAIADAAKLSAYGAAWGTRLGCAAVGAALAFTVGVLAAPAASALALGVMRLRGARYGAKIPWSW